MQDSRTVTEFVALTADEQANVVGGDGYVVKWLDIVASLLGISAPSPSAPHFAL